MSHEKSESLSISKVSSFSEGRSIRKSLTVLQAAREPSIGSRSGSRWRWKICSVEDLRLLVSHLKVHTYTKVELEKVSAHLMKRYPRPSSWTQPTQSDSRFPDCSFHFNTMSSLLKRGENMGHSSNKQMEKETSFHPKPNFLHRLPPHALAPWLSLLAKRTSN